MRRRYPERRRREPIFPRRRVALLLLMAAVIFPFLHRPAVQVPMPQRMAELALSQVDKVDYFWGGKSSRIGPDPRWGMLARVTSAGSDTTDTLRPYGLDCSGLVAWAAVNAAGSIRAYEMIGEGVRAQYANCDPIDWDKVRPGDLCFFPDLSHVGIVAGRGEGGTVEVVHSSKTLGGVVRSKDAALIGFTEIGRPRLYKQFTSFSG